MATRNGRGMAVLDGLTIAEFAERTGLTLNQVSHRVKAGQIKGKKVEGEGGWPRNGRWVIPQEEVERIKAQDAAAAATTEAMEPRRGSAGARRTMATTTVPEGVRDVVATIDAEIDRAEKDMLEAKARMKRLGELRKATIKSHEAIYTKVEGAVHSMAGLAELFQSSE